MKKIFNVTILIAVLLLTSYQVLSQPTPGEQSGSGPILGGPIGGGAPIGSGLTLLIALGMVYGANKLLLLKKISQVN